MAKEERSTRRWQQVGLMLMLAAGGSGCAARTPPVPLPESGPAPSDAGTVPDALADEPGEEAALADLGIENARLQAELAEARTELAALEERHAALLAEVDRELEEVLDSKASLRGVQNRALAISRIAEVRVQMGNMAESEDVEVSSRLLRAGELLKRADRALQEGNFGGASYLADRAGDFVRNARSVAEIRSRRGAPGVIPIAPPRRLEVVTGANLREGPGIDRRRVAGVEVGRVLLATARLGSWYEVELDSGGTAWIHRSTVR